MKQLYCRDLRPGDVLLEMATPALAHKIIKLGQRLAAQPNAFLAHTAIALDTQFAIEALRVGGTANHLAMRNKDAGYYVYRCSSSALGQGAATCAKMLFDISRSGKLQYDLIGACTSIIGNPGSPKAAAEMDALLDNFLKGKGGRLLLLPAHCLRLSVRRPAIGPAGKNGLQHLGREGLPFQARFAPAGQRLLPGDGLHAARRALKRALAASAR